MTTIRELIDELIDVERDGGPELEVRLCNFGPPLDEQGIYEGPIWTNRGGNDGHHPRIAADTHIVYIDFDAYEDPLPRAWHRADIAAKCGRDFDDYTWGVPHLQIGYTRGDWCDLPPSRWGDLCTRKLNHKGRCAAGNGEVIVAVW